MEILRNIEQINTKLKDLFSFSEEDIANERFIKEFMPDDLLKSIGENAGNLDDKKSILEGLRELIFQLSDYFTPLCNLTKLLLYSKNYNQIYLLITKLFVGQIGAIRYVSSSATNFTERYFDRFIEIVKKMFNLVWRI